MARHSKAEKQTRSEIDEKRAKTIEKFFGLSDKVLKHIEWSIAATRLCTHCQTVEGQHKPGRAVNAEGRCAFCGGSNLVPDVDQRNWASGEIADRIAPKPKAVDMTVEQETTISKEAVEKLSTEELEKIQKALEGVNLGD